MPFPSIDTLGVDLLGPVLIVRIVLFNRLNVVLSYNKDYYTRNRQRIIPTFDDLFLSALTIL